ncbi:MAG: hypothetical protein J1E60_07475 [Christensenellaceae bacterium]|nr:hypothetical protein [Christensenellaceae bacterium]
MNNGKSRLISTLDANLVAMILFLCCAVFGFMNGFSGWISLMVLALAVVLFFLDSNSFVRRCAVQTAFFSIIALISTFIFRTILISWLFLGAFIIYIPSLIFFFVLIDWIVRVIVVALAVISCVQAYNGYRFKVPFLGDLIDKVCDKLGVF